jgi:hypothetical protein
LSNWDLSAGHDVAPWSDDRRPSAIACLDYSTASNKDNFYAGANGIDSGKYAYNNLQDYDGTWYHKFNAKWHMATEAWYMYERDVPNVAGNVANPIPTETGANGAFCKAGEVTCTAPEYAVVNYVNREINPKCLWVSGLTFLTIRRDSARGLLASTPRTHCMRRSTSAARCCSDLSCGSTTPGMRAGTTPGRAGTSSSSAWT